MKYFVCAIGLLAGCTSVDAGGDGVFDTPPDSGTTSGGVVSVSVSVSATAGSSATAGPGGTGATSETTTGASSGDSASSGSATDSAGSGGTGVSVFCGDAIPGMDEQCDDGNFDNTDDCTEQCLLPICGDGWTQPGNNETCDDGNNIDGDGCNANCIDSGAVIWTETVAGSGRDEGHGIAIDSTGALVLTGQLEGPTDGLDVWLSRRSAADGSDAGAGHWTRTISSVGDHDDVGWAVATDSQDRIHVAGSMYSPVLPDDGIKAWVAQYLTTGNVVWTDFGDEDSNGFGITVDHGDANAVYAVGDADGTGNTPDTWVRRLDAAGTESWTRTWNFTGNCGANFPDHLEHSQSVLVDGSRVWASGWWHDPNTCTAPDRHWSTIAYNKGTGQQSFNPDGCCPDWRTPGTADEAWGSAADSAGNVIIVGRGQYHYLQPVGGLILKYTPGLSFELWYLRLTADHLYYDVAIDSADNIIVVGTRNSAGQGREFLVRKLDPDGNELWDVAYDGPGSGDDAARSVAIDGNDFIYAIGHQTGLNDRDIVIRKYAP